MRGSGLEAILAVVLSAAIVSAVAAIPKYWVEETEIEMHNGLTREDYREQLQQELHGE